MVVRCRVVPGASRTEVKGGHGDALRLRVAAPPEGGRANREACGLLESVFGGSAEVVGGASARDKKILLRGVGRAEAESVAASLG
ncbi:MAG: DUF167 domain-containing protein [Actinomycetota bacterium]